MTWVRFDDQFPIHRKVGGLTDALYRLHTEAIFWCARNTTDGVIRRDELPQVSQRARPAAAATLVQRGVWHTADELCGRCKDALSEAGTSPPPDGWVVHDYLVFQPSRAKVSKERDAKAERQKRWLDKRTQSREQRASRKPSRDASHSPSIDASKDDAPPPPRPEGSGAEPRASDRRPTAVGRSGGRGDDDNPDWRTLPAAGAARDPLDVERTRRGLALVRDQISRPKEAS